MRRPIEELFQVILDTSVEAVNAGRGVLMAIEKDQLVLRANHGGGLQISSAVLKRVLEERTSMLILDAAQDEALSLRQSIVAAQVRSILAVPLQTEERAIGLIYLDSQGHVRNFTSDDLNLLTVMGNIAATRIEHARLQEIEQLEKLLIHDLDQAAEIQRGLLPLGAPEAAGFDIAGYNAPCRTVGGDYFDFLRLPDGRLGLALGDVAGKGMPAALLMSSLHARVQVIFEQSSELSENLQRLNRSVTANCPRNRFITFFFAALNQETGELSYSNAGHNPPFVVHSDGSSEVLDATGMVLGITPRASYAERHCKLNPGDLLLVFSDGVTEAASPSGEEFGEARLLEVIRSHRHASAACIIDEITRELAVFTGACPPADDITLVVVRRIE